ncbi:hypothetical protein DFR48_101178 [Ciceribacter lividus]|uniref:Uncharacterized protein n=1 Tax=Ciceribacter lividus TaxID=1197950 RepID=A0A6I7HTE2_9HYPH|nr:hypothetical protein DFR48_101178 [Ciceribacter lividus]
MWSSCVPSLPGERTVVKQRRAAAFSARWKAAAVAVAINHFGTDTEAEIEADVS